MGCPPKFVSLARQLHKAEVVCEGDEFQSFYVKTGVKQGCVLALTLFALFLAAMMAEMICKVGSRGVSVQYRMGSTFCRRLCSCCSLSR